MATTRWACSMVDRRWAMTRVVRWRIRSSSAACTARSLSLSRAEVASSRMSTGASLYSARAMARRWRCPPDNWPPLWPMTVSTPCGRLSTNSARCAPSSAWRTRAGSTSAPSATLAATLSLNSTTSWLTKANWRRRARTSHCARGTPSSSTCPSLGATKRGSRFTSEVLPAPEGPTRATVCPGAMCRFTPCSAPSWSSR